MKIIPYVVCDTNWNARNHINAEMQEIASTQTSKCVGADLEVRRYKQNCKKLSEPELRTQRTY
jgi:hypothetical protein